MITQYNKNNNSNLNTSKISSEVIESYVEANEDTSECKFEFSFNSVKALYGTIAYFGIEKAANKNVESVTVNLTIPDYFELMDYFNENNIKYIDKKDSNERYYMEYMGIKIDIDLELNKMGLAFVETISNV